MIEENAKIIRLVLQLYKKSITCIVFFIVLDLRLTKIGTQRSPFFYAHKSDTSKNKD